MERIRWQRSANPLGTVLEGFVGTRQAFVLRNDRSQERGNWRLKFFWAESPELRGIGVIPEETAKQVAENLLEHWLLEAGLIEDKRPKPFDVALLKAVEDALREGNGNTTLDAPPVLLAALYPVQKLVVEAGLRASGDGSHKEELGWLAEVITDAIEKISGGVA